MRKPRLPLDRATADRLATGALHPSDAPPGYERAAAVLGEARTAAPDPAAAEVDERLLGDLVLAIGSQPVDAPAGPARTGLGAKVAAVAAAAVLSATGVAAAATGNLPGPAQDALSEVAGAVGIDLPTTDDEGSADDDSLDTDDGDEVDAGDDEGADDGSGADDDGADGDDDGDDGTPGSGDGSGNSGTGGATAAHAGNPTDRDDHGAAVSETARSIEAEGREKGAAVSEVARSGRGGVGGGTTTTTTSTPDTTTTTADDDDADDGDDGDDDEEGSGSSERGAGAAPVDPGRSRGGRG